MVCASGAGCACKGQAQHSFPLALLARLAIGLRLNGQGVGTALLRDARRRIAVAVDTIGARALLVHVKDERARGFYAHLGFEPSPLDALHLVLLVKDLKARIWG